MQGHTKAFVAILVLGVVAILGYKFALPRIQDALQRETSDAAATTGKLTIGVDNWVGYFPLCSPEMRKRMRAEGWTLSCVDDQADYAGRFKRLAEGELDFAVATVDAYLLNGAQLDFPAAIIMVIDESKGGDAIVARRTSVPDLEALKLAGQVPIAFTPGSPSEHLLKSVGTHFDLPQLSRPRGKFRVEASGSSDAMARLLRGDVDVAVLWEPDVSKALASPDFVKLIGTDDTDKLIVDVLLASRRAVQEQPAAIKVLLEQYFETLRAYDDAPTRLRADLSEASGAEEPQVAAMLAGVRWATLNENGGLWFGITPSGLPEQEGLVRAINGAIAVLTAVGDFTANPLPDSDPYRLTNRQFISELYLRERDGTAATSSAATSLSKRFAALDEAGWNRLKEIGTLKIEPIGFARGTASLDDDSRGALDAIAEKLSHYPNYRLMIRGHTGIGGDATANVELSKRRAEAVLEYLGTRYDMDPNRIRALGFGGSRPLPRLPDESDRAYGYRLPRVEFALLADRF